MTAVTLQAGELNRHITLQTRASSQDSYGQQAATWSDWATCWAHIRPISGREVMTAQAINAETTHVITIRYRPGVTAAMRAVFGSRLFNILAVTEPEMAHVTLELLCSEGLNPG